MKRIILCLSLFAVFESQAQQINPVPDYVFSNKMSVGRNAVTDTAAYFSIGPRYGAIRGFMPPMVTDTASVTGTKRNGLTIFSIQKNKYVYWDSVRVQWSDFAGSSGAYIFATDTASMLTPYLRKSDTSSMLTPYIRAAGNGLTKSGQSLLVDTAAMATRARVQKAVDSINANVALKVNISDTASMLSPYIRHAGNGLTKTGQALSVDTAAIATRARVQKGIDSLGAVKGSGTVTSVSAGTGMSFTTITTTGSVAVDTLTLSTRAWRKKGDDSLGAVIATRTDTTLLSTRAWRQKGLDSLAAIEIDGSGTVNYVPKFTATRTLGNSQIFDNGTAVGINATNLTHRLRVFGTGRFDPSATKFIYIDTAAHTTLTNLTAAISFSRSADGADNMAALFGWNNGGIALAGREGIALATGGSVKYPETTERMRIFANGRVGVNTITDAGYQLDINGTLRSVNGANFATTSGNVGIGTTSPSERLHVSGKARITTIDSSSSPINLLWSNVDGVIQKTSVASVIGSGTAKYIPKFATATTLTNSLIYEDNNEVRINTTSDAGDWVLQVSGNSLVSNGQLRVSANANTGISLARSGTSEVFMETGNTSGGLKVGVAGSTGGSSQGFSGYAGYILTNAAYPLQFGSLDTMRMTLNTAGELLISTSTTDNGNYKLQVDGNVWSTGSLTTGDPTSGTKKPWKLGSKVATSVQLDTANYVEVEIDGVFVRLAIVTPL